MGYFPNLKKPTTFNEKLQWLKLNDRNDLYTKLTDKYAVDQFSDAFIPKSWSVK